MRRYFVTTFGCQMNAHDSERIKGMLESLGLGEAPSQEEADVLVFNTCTVREKPDTKLAAYLGEAAARKRRRPDLVVAVGGCYAEAQREQIRAIFACEQKGKSRRIEAAEHARSRCARGLKILQNTCLPRSR